MFLTETYHKLSKTKKAAIWFLFANFLTKGIGFITVPVFAYFLSTEEYGKFSVFLTYQSALLLLATFEMYGGAFTRGILRYKDNLSLFTYSEQLLSVGLTVVCFLISIPLMPLIISKSQIDLCLYLLMYGFFLVFPGYQCWITLKRFEYDYKPVVFSVIIYSVLSTLIPLFGVMKFPLSSVRIILMLFVQIAVCLPFFIRNVHLFELISCRQVVLEHWRYLLSFQTPAVAHGLSYIALSSLDRIMIEEMLGNSDVGVYSLASTISAVIMVICVSANQVLKPWRLKRMEEGSYGSIKKCSDKVLLAFGFVILLWILIAPDVIRIFFREEYYGSIWSIPPLSVSVFFVFLYSMYVDVEEYYYKTKYIMYATTISAVVNVILNYYGIPIFGYVVCSYTTLFSYVFLAFLHLLWLKKACKEKGLTADTIFNIKNTCYYSIIIIFVGVLITLTYSYDLLRLLLIVLILCISLLNYRKIKSVISSFFKGEI